MISQTHTVVVLYEGIYYKLFKIVYGADGSFYVTCPYVPSDNVTLVLQTVNYDKKESVMSLDETVDIGSLTEDTKKLKLSHHLSGLLQFSGEGIISGIESDGTIRGIGTMSWPVNDPPAGPAFAMTINGLTSFAQATKLKTDTHLFSFEPTVKIPALNSLVVEGHCFPAVYRRFIRENHKGEMIINTNHPSGMSIPMRVALPNKEATCQSFLGLELYFESFGVKENSATSYVLSGSTGNLRFNENGERIGDGLYCFYPARAKEDVRSLKFIPRVGQV
jgi:hypothetical protein